MQRAQHQTVNHTWGVGDRVGKPSSTPDLPQSDSSTNASSSECHRLSEERSSVFHFPLYTPPPPTPNHIIPVCTENMKSFEKQQKVTSTESDQNRNSNAAGCVTQMHKSYSLIKRPGSILGWFQGSRDVNRINED